MNIFILEDDYIYGLFLKQCFEQTKNVHVSCFVNGSDFFEALKNEKPDLISLDLSLPDMNGLDVLKKIKKEFSNIPVIIITGQSDIEKAQEIILEGVFDYIVKSDKIDSRIHFILKKFNHLKELNNEVTRLKKTIINEYNIDFKILGISDTIKNIQAMVKSAAISKLNISIMGEKGTGKSLIAELLHYNSDHQTQPFVSIDLDNLSPEQIEIDLFGLEIKNENGLLEIIQGKLEKAYENTLYIKNIHLMPLATQIKLYQAIHNKIYYRVNGTNLLSFDSRLIVSTYKNLSNEVSKKQFKENLFYKIIGIPIHVPNLKSRENDVIILANHFINLICIENRVAKKILSDDAIKKIAAHDYKHNLAELKAVIQLAVAISQKEIILPEHIIFTNQTLDYKYDINEDLSMEEYTLRILNHYLKKYNNNVGVVAQKLDVGKSTIYRLLKEHKL
jgi:DNA-binding NtrC family response regulator